MPRDAVVVWADLRKEACNVDRSVLELQHSPAGRGKGLPNKDRALITARSGEQLDSA
jgi:hypothetical protein